MYLRMIRDQRLDRVGHFHNLPVLLDHPHLTSPELTSMSVQVGRAASVRRVLGRCPPLSHHLSEILAGSSRRASRPCGLVHLPIVFVDTPLWAGHTDLIKMAIGPNPHVVARTMTISSPSRAPQGGASIFIFCGVRRAGSTPPTLRRRPRFAGYPRWRNRHCHPELHVAFDSKNRRPDCLPNVARRGTRRIAFAVLPAVSN